MTYQAVRKAIHTDPELVYICIYRDNDVDIIPYISQSRSLKQIQLSMEHV